MKKTKIIPAVGVTTAAAAGTFMGLLYRYIFDRDRGPLGIVDSRKHDDSYYELRDRKAEELRRKRSFTLACDSPDGLRLLGFYYPRGTELSRRIAFIVHGYHSEHCETAGMVYEYWHSRGFDVFCPDHRAHGESQGELIGYDALESKDCLRWIELLRGSFGEDIEIVLHGFSMGGATVLKMSDQVLDNVKFIISDSGFTSAGELISSNIGPLTRVMNGLNRKLSGYDLRETDVRENVRHSRVPILFVHGTEDPTVPFAMGKELYELCPEPKGCLFIEGAKHIECTHRAPVDYAKKVDKFVDSYAPCS